MGAGFHRGPQERPGILETVFLSCFASNLGVALVEGRPVVATEKETGQTKMLPPLRALQEGSRCLAHLTEGTAQLDRHLMLHRSHFVVMKSQGVAEHRSQFSSHTMSNAYYQGTYKVG